ncbi:MAG TPA: bifunctional sulfate adenylyltransferase/adenylylsulfate kinase [Thermoanaerobaculia bacterium]|nr:bifunctional sulfate adenylyltransferase/adenylylsulfate kinase [Thermoanaerobaculia bacterium]
MIEPHGGRLLDLLAAPERAAELKAASRDWPSWDLTARQQCDLELLLSGAFSPLTGFLGRADHDAVCERMRLADGTLWPLPVALEVPPELGARLRPGAALALRDAEGVMLAALTVEETWEREREPVAEAVFGTTDRKHPGVADLYEREGWVALAGRLEGLQLPAHYDFRSLRLTPVEVRQELTRRGWRRVVAFQTRNPMHRAHCELALAAAKQAQANLLIHPVVGMTKPGDLDHYTRVRCYQAVLERFPPQTAMLALLPLSMRMAGPREALFHAIVRKNFGCTHFIVGRDHAGPGNDSRGRPFYGPYDAQEMLRAHEAELGVEMVPFQNLVYVEDRDAYLQEDQVPQGARTLTISGTDLRSRLAEGREIPAWFTYPEVASELRRTHPPRHRQGFTVFLTGLSGAGKSTIAGVLLVKLLEMGGRPVTLLDGDIVRKHLSSELTFSKAHRDINIRRIGFVASEITKNGGIALCAPIAPYDAVRKEVRRMVEPGGGFVLVHVATPLAVCEERDRKGLYAKARAGLIPEFTGISDPYEPPLDAELSIDASEATPEEAAQEILLYLERAGFVGALP